MIKGVNRQVVEVTETGCDYFERVLFFIKPEFSAISEGELRTRAASIAQSVGLPPAARVRRSRLRAFLRLTAAALCGAALCGAVTALALRL